MKEADDLIKEAEDLIEEAKAYLWWQENWPNVAIFSLVLILVAAYQLY